MAFPGRNRRFEPLELGHSFQQAVFPLQPRSRRHVLPAQQEAQEVLGAHRLYLLSQAVQGVAVDAGQQAAVAELLLIDAGAEAAAQHEALAFQPRQP